MHGARRRRVRVGKRLRDRRACVGWEGAAIAAPGSAAFFAAVGAALKGLSATGDRARSDELFTRAQEALGCELSDDPSASRLGRATGELAKEVRALIAGGKRQIWVLRLGGKASPHAPLRSSS